MSYDAIGLKALGGLMLTEARMRDLSFVIRGAVNLMPPGEKDQEAPSSPAYQAANPLRRRLEDAAEDAFHAALRRSDLASAEDLLDVMENMHARGRVRFQSERKGTALMIDRARKELESRTARRHPSAG